MQVAISVVAAVHVDDREPEPRRLRARRPAARLHPGTSRKPYLGKFISTPSDWTPLQHYANVFDGYAPPQIDPTDPWQFKNFLVARSRLGGRDKTLQKLAKEHGTPLFVIDHDELRENYATFKKHLPRVQAYYAVKANSDPEIVKTFYEAGASFDVASMAEFRLVYENIKRPAGQRAAGLHLGQDHLRQPDQGHRHARGARPVQAARHLRQPRRDRQDRRSTRRTPG